VFVVFVFEGHRDSTGWNQNQHNNRRRRGGVFFVAETLATAAESDTGNEAESMSRHLRDRKMVSQDVQKNGFSLVPALFFF